ncbi:hypothetical protein HanRHA438_Chr10g0446381 [Helianthus annuus]|nr:hypothetical protein HanIR_Chr10g0468131 [Helianthus annuus]KAJ0879003.1 hypothetical protein HanRHA438_Chr10g0446381 [Helianthus annuus]
MLNDPNLFNRMTSGIEGNTKTASILSLCFSTAAFTFKANSSTNIKDPMKIFASSRSIQKLL